MPDFLKGNFTTKNKIEEAEKGDESLEDRFETKALRRLGGSIAFVSKKQVKWNDGDQ